MAFMRVVYMWMLTPNPLELPGSPNRDPLLYPGNGYKRDLPSGLEDTPLPSSRLAYSNPTSPPHQVFTPPRSSTSGRRIAESSASPEYPYPYPYPSLMHAILKDQSPSPSTSPPQARLYPTSPFPSPPAPPSAAVEAAFS
ncbi:hypothetical protein NMY22_g14585 [Coprinellus aureogranulatus]|nr:hypothetical protein NMY22_g14585 [Coprinellus aureogranulatus]